MTLMDIVSIISFTAGIVSIVLAIYAMVAARRSEQRSKTNFDQTQDMIRKFYDSTKDLLSDINTRTVVTERVITDSQEKLLSTMTAIINETVLPKKQDMAEQFGLLFFQHMLTNPSEAENMMKALQPMIEMSHKAGKP